MKLINKSIEYSISYNIRRNEPNSFLNGKIDTTIYSFWLNITLIWRETKINLINE